MYLSCTIVDLSGNEIYRPGAIFLLLIVWVYLIYFYTVSPEKAI